MTDQMERGRRGASPNSLPLGAALLLLLLFAAAAGSFPTLKREGQASVQVGGKTFHVDVAATPATRAVGLSGWEYLAEDGGMLFLFDAPGRYIFWMKGTRIALDIFWIRAGTIVCVHEDAQPPLPGTAGGDMERFSSPEPADMVLETRAGTARELGIRAGQPAHILLPSGLPR